MQHHSKRANDYPAPVNEVTPAVYTMGKTISENRVKELATLLNEEVSKIANTIGQIGDVKLMVLAAITILDKNQDILDDAVKDIEDSNKKLEKILSKIEKII